MERFAARDVAKISFTDSVAVGKTIMREGAATMKRVMLRRAADCF